MSRAYFKRTIATAALMAAFMLPGSAAAESAEQKLNAIADEFGAVLQLSGTPAAKEINAIAALIIPESGMMTIDLDHASREFCMLEPTSKSNMIHFSSTPEKTTEDILYFISPDEFKEKGLRVKDLTPLPKELNKMVPLKWYYYDGESIEPHHGKKLHRDFLVMAIDVK